MSDHKKTTHRVLVPWKVREALKFNRVFAYEPRRGGLYANAQYSLQLAERGVSMTDYLDSLPGVGVPLSKLGRVLPVRFASSVFRPWVDPSALGFDVLEENFRRCAIHNVPRDRVFDYRDLVVNVSPYTFESRRPEHGGTYAGFNLHGIEIHPAEGVEWSPYPSWEEPGDSPSE